MSRAITIKFFESARERIMMEEGLSNAVVDEMKAGTDNYIKEGMQVELNKMELNSFVIEEIQEELNAFIMDAQRLDFVPIQEIKAPSRSYDFPEIRYWKQGPMTFIEIIVPSSPHYREYDLQAISISDAILAEKTIPDFKEEQNIRKDEKAIKDNPVLKEFSDVQQLNDAFADEIQFLKDAGKEISFKEIEGDFRMPKALPLHEDLMSLNDLFSRFKKRENVKVKRKTKERVH